MAKYKQLRTYGGVCTNFAITKHKSITFYCLNILKKNYILLQNKLLLFLFYFKCQQLAISALLIIAQIHLCRKCLNFCHLFFFITQQSYFHFQNIIPCRYSKLTKRGDPIERKTWMCIFQKQRSFKKYFNLLN